MANMTDEVSRRYEPPVLEGRIARYWKEHRCFERSIEIRRGSPPFIFLEGPPTANGLPGVHHVLARAYKDLVCRHRTMTGHLVERKAGWDTHGLPVELEVERELGLHNKKEIEGYGIERFNERCRESVWRYLKEWRSMTDRMAFWVDQDHPYITLDPAYMESVWWSLRQLWDKGLIHKGVRVVPYCPRCGTTLSSHEVAQGYDDAEDPSIFIRFRLKGREGVYILAWTTTPWTLISNVALAVHPEQRYALVVHRGERLILAEALLGAALDGPYEVERTFFGSELEGQLYEPLFSFVELDRHAHFVATADFVTLETGTGVVHVAPAFGEDDAELAIQYDLPAPQPVDGAGKFTAEVTPWAGQFVKDADESIMQDLKRRGLLYKRGTFVHTYPFCWRCDSPLLYYTVPSWYIRMSHIRERVQERNREVEWHPPNIREGRFGDFLENLKDWSLSRDRYWGTPLPVWRCGSCGQYHCVGSIEELRRMAKSRPAGELDLHRPFIDAWVLGCPKCGADMVREPSVIDVWYDSGSAFFAQWHYPFENQDRFNSAFPVDFICEAMDQTRGWFYTMHAIAVSVFDSVCYRNCLALGLIHAKDGKRMSKSRGTAVDPWDIFDTHGSDALRWYFYSAHASWLSLNFDVDAVREVVGRFMLTLYNTHSFYHTYAELDGFGPASPVPEPAKRSHLDRWLLSRLQATVEEASVHMEGYEVHRATRAIEAFVVDDLSNWYVRRSRRRVWGGAMDDDKAACYGTLREALHTLGRLTAPMIPFLSEEIYLGVRGPSEQDSVHLSDWPRADPGLRDTDLEASMALARQVCDAVRAMRAADDIKNRQPLRRAVLVGEAARLGPLGPLLPLIADESNVKEVGQVATMEQFLERRVRPNMGRLGPRFKGDAPKVVKAVHEADAQKLLAEVESKGSATLPGGYTVAMDDLVVDNVDKGGFKTQQVGDVSVVLDVQLDDALVAEGFAREVVRRVQEMRKDMDLDLEEEVAVSIQVDAPHRSMLERHLPHLKEEVRASSVALPAHAPASEAAPEGPGHRGWDIDGVAIEITLARAR